MSDIKALLAAHGLRPRHRFGQNFLHDARRMEKIIAAAELSPGDAVLEVGPGTGALSARLLAAGASLVAVEIDRDFEPILRQVLHLDGDNAGRVRLIIDDVLDGKHAINRRVLAALASPPCDAGAGPVAPHDPAAQRVTNSEGQAVAPAGGGAFKLVANLPYHVASPLIANLLLAPYENERSPRLTLAVVMIQREVAARLCAAPGGKDYGPLGVLVQAMCQVERIDTLPPGCFWPPPTVESAVVRLRVRQAPLTRRPAQLSQLLHDLFSKRRKQLGSILGRDAALPAGIHPTQRPEELTVEQLIALAQTRQGISEVGKDEHEQEGKHPPAAPD